ncbi:MAG: alpha/beta fold hydrolase [Novosphingobium sp.]|jgi:pimeloyl-ACP methyl ester carboxylesterase|uniref:alpha/beta fold hydrolase n=1 Tax=Novosphingobium sp. TaxID=1874826 RepID=UPI00391CE4EA|nr:alpha/beta hydrolase [Novosphingobium sp.]
MNDFTDGYWTSRDGLQLHYRDYPGRADRPPVLCLPGLTRNARDFEELAQRLAGEWRVICVELRGRGDSAYAKDSATYNPLQYLEDLGELFDQAGLTRVVAIGTSLGGLLTMLLAATAPQRLAGALLNDIGPEVNPEGIERIRNYVGQARNFPTWMHAARALAESQGPTFPNASLTDWLAMAKRCMVVGSNGRIHFDYDMKIAEPFAQADGASNVDMWPAFEALAGRPVTLLRGALSDVLTPATFKQMAKRLPEAETVTVPKVGHAPTLSEPAAMAAINQLLARIA